MPVDERQKLLDRLTALSGGDSGIAALYEDATLEELRALVSRLDADARRAEESPAGRLGEAWRDDSAVIVEHAARDAAE